MSRASGLLAELLQFTRYDPGKSLKDSNKKDIEGSTALSVNSVAYYDPDSSAGGHFITRHGLNDKVENFKITHEEALHLLQHLRKFSGKPLNRDGTVNDTQNASQEE